MFINMLRATSEQESRADQPPLSYGVRMRPELAAGRMKFRQKNGFGPLAAICNLNYLNRSSKKKETAIEMSVTFLA
jgi:hypothetical protein